jgi:hypothetical protein
VRLPRKASPGETSKSAERIRKALQRALIRIKAIERPQTGRKGLRRFLSAFEDTNASLKRFARAAGGDRRGPVKAARRKLATTARRTEMAAEDFGFKKCGGTVTKPVERLT